MKRKRKVTNAKKTSGGSAMSSGPPSSQPGLRSQEPAENCMTQGDSSLDQGRKLETPDQDMDVTGDHQAGPSSGLTEGQLNTTNPEMSSPLPLPAVTPTCHQGEHHDIDAADSTNPTEQVSDGIADHLWLMPLEILESDVKCPDEADMAATSITETTDISEQVYGESKTSETISKQVNGEQQTDEMSDIPIIFIEGRCMEVDSCKTRDVSKMQLIETCMDKDVSALPVAGCHEPNSDSQETPPARQPRNETPDLSNTPDIPEITPQSSLEGANDKSPTPDYDAKIQGRDEAHGQDLQGLMSPEEPGTKMAEQAIPSHQTAVLTEDPRVLTDGLDLPDSLLGALEDSFYEPGKSTGDHRQEAPQTTASPPHLPVQDTGGPQERRTKDASSTVQGLILELSNINRLIMSTYRELRQKRLRLPAGRGSVSGKRRRCEK